MRLPLACLAAAACISAAPTPPAPRPNSMTSVEPAKDKAEPCTPRAVHARTTDGEAVLRNELLRPGQPQPVNLYLAVERLEDGCSVPVIARQDVYRGNRAVQGWIQR